MSVDYRLSTVDCFQATVACALCGRPTGASEAAEAGWLPADVVTRLAAAHRGWTRDRGGCAPCVQEALLATLLENGEAAFHEGVQRAWPLDAQAAFGALPTPLRLHADPRFTGRGVTLALVDAAFHPHPDLVQPRNRIRMWVDAGHAVVHAQRFAEDEVPRWPGWDALESGQWHGLMTSVTAAGNGTLSRGLYRGLAPDADLVLVQVRDDRGRITNEGVARALRWLERNMEELRPRVVSLSVGGEAVDPLRGNIVDTEVARLVERGVTVVAASGNDGHRRLLPPATAPDALTVGGLDDGNTFDHAEVALWHGNYGEAADGRPKPEVVAPSLWVVAPVLPGTPLSAEAHSLFERRAAGDGSVEARLKELKLVTPHYQHVEGTSFAAPIAASLAACMIEADPALSPGRVRELLMASARPIPGAPPERQGAGGLDARRAVALALGGGRGRRRGRAPDCATVGAGRR